MPSLKYTYEGKADRAKEKIKETFGDDLNNLQVQTAKTIIQTAITAMKDGTTMKDYYLGQGAGLVIAVQILMKQLGLYPFQLDGIMGPQFKNCVKNFQSKNGLVVDYQPGIDTLQKLLSIVIVANPKAPKAPAVKEKQIKKETVTYGKDSYNIINGVITIDGVSYVDASKANFTGKGYLKNKDHIYVGDRKNDKIEGKGTHTRSDGAKYVGDYKNDKIEGKGTYTNPYNKIFTGTRKEGHLINNKKRLLSTDELDEVKDKNEFGKIANLAPNII